MSGLVAGGRRGRGGLELLDELVAETAEPGPLGLGDRVSRDELLTERIDKPTIFDHTVIKVGAGRETGRAHVTDDLFLSNAPPLADSPGEPRQVVVHGAIAQPVLDQDSLAVSPLPTGREDHPVGDCPDRRAYGGGIIDGEVRPYPTQDRVVPVVGIA